MRSLTDDNRAENPIEVMFVIMLAMVVMTVVTFVFGNVIDQFMFTWAGFLDTNPLQGSWAISMYANIVTNNVSLFWKVLGFFIIVFIVWGIKTMVKKTEYTTTGQEIMSDEY